MIRFELGTLGIVEGDEKRILEAFIGEESFTRRKNYDEFYCRVTTKEVDVDIKDLMWISEHFRVLVVSDAIIISGGRR